MGGEHKQGMVIAYQIELSLCFLELRIHPDRSIQGSKHVGCGIPFGTRGYEGVSTLAAPAELAFYDSDGQQCRGAAEADLARPGTRR